MEPVSGCASGLLVPPTDMNNDEGFAMSDNDESPLEPQQMTQVAQQVPGQLSQVGQMPAQQMQQVCQGM
ncbi:hypothetical protein AB4Z39_05115 [Mycobacterium adipatum]|uniref:hypothetical protein n=1 Tax=Mycobacterium adipatum TaxID=1682113 RepID=UPI0034E08FA4